MLIIRNCNLINMAGIYEEKKDLVVENGKILDICDNAVSKYNVGHVSIDACGHYVTPGFVEPHCQLGVREQVFRFEGDDSDESTDPILPPAESPRQSPAPEMQISSAEHVPLSRPPVKQSPK